MKPTHYTSREGGYWQPWPEKRGQVGAIIILDGDNSIELKCDEMFVGEQIHSIKFDDNSEWDEISGFRGPDPIFNQPIEADA